MELINGKQISQDIIEELKIEVSKLEGHPCIAFIRVGEDPASVSYVKKKNDTAKKVGMKTILKVLPDTVSRNDLFAQIDAFNEDPNIHGILIQAPLPDHLNENEVFNRVSPQKDVDGLGTLNLGKLVQEDSTGFAACTPSGIIELLKRSGVETSGKHVVIVGRSLLVGKSAALLLVSKSKMGNATVTICHSRTTNLNEITQQADILIAAIGVPHFIKKEMVKPGAIVIDVGINRIPDSSRKSGNRLVGDVDFDEVSPLCSKITPVPGGVGPMTVAMLMKNTVKAFNLSLSHLEK